MKQKSWRLWPSSPLKFYHGLIGYYPWQMPLLVHCRFWVRKKFITCWLPVVRQSLSWPTIQWHMGQCGSLGKLQFCSLLEVYIFWQLCSQVTVTLVWLCMKWHSENMKWYSEKLFQSHVIETVLFLREDNSSIMWQQSFIWYQQDS